MLYIFNIFVSTHDILNKWFSCWCIWLIAGMNISCETLRPWTFLMIDQHWFSSWLGAVRQQAIIWANVKPDLCGHMPSLAINVTPGNLIARSRQKSTRSRHKPPVLGKKHPFSVKSARSQYNPPVIRTLFSQSRLMWPRKNKLLSK